MSLIIPIAAIFGAAFGSFLNVVILRFPYHRSSQNPSSPPLIPTSPKGFAGRGRGENAVDPPDSVLPKPRAEEDKGDDRGFYRQEKGSENSFWVLFRSLGGRSRCPHCHRQLTFWDLIPIISWLLLRGRCRTCRAPISIQYPIVELFGAAAAALLARAVITSTLHPLIALLLFFIVSLLIVLFVIDLRTMLLPDIFIYFLVGLAILILVGNIFATPFLSAVAPDSPTTSASRFMEIASSLPWALAPASSLYSALLGAFIGSGSILTLWFLTSGRGIGFGDVKLMIPLGLLFGPIHTVILLFSAFICGGLFGTYLLITKQATLKTAVPFGPFLAGVAIIFILFPQVPEYLLSLII